MPLQEVLGQHVVTEEPDPDLPRPQAQGVQVPARPRGLPPPAGPGCCRLECRSGLPEIVPVRQFLLSPPAEAVAVGVVMLGLREGHLYPGFEDSIKLI